MIMLGMTMTEVDWKDIFSHLRIYLITILKMVVTPLIILLLLKYLPVESLVKDGKTILLISLMAVITPSATTVVQLAQLYDQDPPEKVLNAEYEYLSDKYVFIIVNAG